MSKPMTFSEMRDQAHRLIHDKPDELEMIASNYAKALWVAKVPAITFEACMMELFRRHMHAPIKATKG